MIFLKFLRQQDWKYAIPCILILSFFLDFIIPDSVYSYLYNHNYLAWQLGFATGFLVCYSLKFAGKYNNLFIDQLKLFFYFVFFTVILLFPDTQFGILTFELSPWILFYLYLYSILIFYKQEMEQQGKPILNFHWLSIIIFQTIFIFMVIVWAITQKVEAEKQKVLAVEAKTEAARVSHQANTNEAKYNHRIEEQRDSTRKYKWLYEKALEK